MIGAWAAVAHAGSRSYALFPAREHYCSAKHALDRHAHKAFVHAVAHPSCTIAHAGCPQANWPTHARARKVSRGRAESCTMVRGLYATYSQADPPRHDATSKKILATTAAGAIFYSFSFFF
ncbi:hypothetical protein Salat_2775100 [Sesamum alatum]|uniref:Uncharacterized protein n=1 Tax=Sesamum alatum TaxID=300844 RepID=A0AAE1XLJ9_9LAMI|nr:hypothetical protein Salat_2775100 [Sesamum alatum]